MTIEYTGRHEDGTVFDTSEQTVADNSGLAEAQPDREYEPLTFEVGAEQVIEGLDEALVGLEQGDTPTVALPPEKAYGEWTEERVQELDAETLAETIGEQTLTEGTYLQSESGHPGEVTSVGEEVVRVDFNPLLAGETVEFSLEVLAVN